LLKVDGIIIEMITSPAEVVVMGAPVGVVVAGWVFRIAVWSKGAVVSTLDNSQMTASPVLAVGLGVIVTVVAPALLFFAYQISTIRFADELTALAFPASTYVFPALSVTLLMLGLAPCAEAQPTTIKWPLPMEGTGQVVAGNAPGPQGVIFNKLI
jgi:hypothetical protein